MLAGGLYYFTLRLKDSTGAGNDGAVEVWCNNVLLYSNYTLDLSAVALSEQAVMLAPYQQTITYARNLTIHDDWTTAQGVAPKHKNVFEVTDLNVISSTDYTLEGSAATISEALTDNDDNSLISTITPEAIAEFGIDQIPTAFATSDVTDVGTRVFASREPNGYAEPTISITDDVGTVFGSTTEPVTAVGANRTKITTIGTIAPATTMDKIRITIDSGE